MKTKSTKLKGAIVLLLAVAMLSTGFAVAAKTPTASYTTGMPAHPSNPVTRNQLVWDNGDFGGGNLLSSQYAANYPFESEMADDFILDATASIAEVVAVGGFWNGAAVNPMDVTVIFYADDGTGNMPTGAGMTEPYTTALQMETHTAVMGTDNGDGSFTYDITLNAPFTAQAGVKYWFVARGDLGFPPQWGFAVSTSQQLHSAMQGFPALGTAYWTDPGYGDVSFKLYSGSADVTPPTTTCTIVGGTVTLAATDDMSGVAFTVYTLDGGALTNYTAPFEAAVGDHTLVFYSVDNAGNHEAAQTKTFTVAPPITIAIKGGFGITATITNGGADPINATGSIAVTGLVFPKNKDIPATTIAAGADATAKMTVFGFGPTTITVTVNGVEQTASGMVLLVFVIGVK